MPANIWVLACLLACFLLALRDFLRVLEHNVIHTDHIGTESTTEGLQAHTYASRPIRFWCGEDCWNLIGLETFVRACSPSVVLSVPKWDEQTSWLLELLLEPKSCVCLSYNVLFRFLPAKTVTLVKIQGHSQNLLLHFAGWALHWLNSLFHTYFNQQLRCQTSKWPEIHFGNILKVCLTQLSSPSPSPQSPVPTGPKSWL